MTTITRDSLAILKKFNRKRDGSYVQGSARDIAVRYNLKTYSPQRPPRAAPPKHILNWGNTMTPNWLNEHIDKGGVVLNHPVPVGRAVDKFRALEVLEYCGIPCLTFTKYNSEAQEWADEGKRVYCRTLSRATQGRGIVIATKPEELVNAPLYTLEYEKNREYRVHVFDGKVIDVQIKKKRNATLLDEMGIEANPDVRNMSNGYVFCRSNIRRNEGMEKACISAIAALQLTFGAVDVLGRVDDDTNELVDFAICEVNTAPALEGTTLEVYMAALADFLDDRVKLTNEFIESVRQAL